MKNRIKDRSSALINRTYKNLVVPDVASRICNMVMRLIDSLIAARWIGLSAMSAIALVTPILLFDSCLHDLLVSGTTPVLIKYKSRGQLREANRAFGAIAAHAFFWYIIIYALVLIFAEDIFRLFTQDEALIADGLKYFIPLAVLQPLCELGLCFERGFKSEGKNGFFGARGIITNILNVGLSILAVRVFHGGIFGISAASCISSLLGYCWSFSYFFSKKCTIRPDLSVLKKPEEVKKYLMEEVQIGSVYALDDGLYAGAAALLNKAVIFTGGTPALTAIGICSAINGIITAITGAIQGAEFNLCNLFYSDRDYKGTVFALRSAVVMETCFTAVVWVLLNVFSRQVGMVYSVDSDIVMGMLRACLCFSALATIADCFTNLFSAFMMATEKTGIARRFVIALNFMIAAGALIGFTGIDFSTLLCVHMVGSILAACGEAFVIIKSQKTLKTINEAEIQTYSYLLNEDSCGEISRKIAELLKAFRPLAEIAPKAALLAEECNRLILYVNRKNEKDISVDFRISADEKECVITLIDTGILFDPVNRLCEGDLPEEFAFSRKILKGLSPTASYARVVDLNVSHLILMLSPRNESTMAEKKETICATHERTKNGRQ